jgi:hypothetical protein
MTVNTSGILKGMDVFGSEGDRIGTVAQVWANPSGENPLFGHVDDVVVVPRESELPVGSQAADFGMNATGPATIEQQYGEPHPMDTAETGYFAVDEGGMLGMGTTQLYVPFDAVMTVLAGDRLTLSCTKDEAGSRFATKPAWLGEG